MTATITSSTLMADCPECEQFSGKLRAMCRGEVKRRELADKFRELRGFHPLLDVTHTAPIQITQATKPKCARECESGKPGDQMAWWLGKYGIPSCLGCSGRQETMNQWGIEGCKEHRAEIIGWLQKAEIEAATKAAKEKHPDREPTKKEIAAEKLATRWRVAKAALLNVDWINPLDPFGSFVDEAIRRAEEKQGARCES